MNHAFERIWYVSPIKIDNPYHLVTEILTEGYIHHLGFDDGSAAF
jgi:hypothetical protein